MSDRALISTLITGGTSLASGVIGFFLREYGNRVKPFISVLKVEGDLRDRRPDESTSAEVIALGKQIYDLTAEELTENSDSDELDSLYREAKQIVNNGQSFISGVDQFILLKEAGNTSESINAIIKILENSTFENWIICSAMIASYRIPKANGQNSEEVEIYEEQNIDEGTFVVKYREKAGATFGKGTTKSKLIKDLCAKFLDLVKKEDVNGLGFVLAKVKDLVQRALPIATQLSEKIKAIQNNQSRWGVQIFIANLSKNPVLINQGAILHIEDAKGARYQLECKLVIFKKDKGGDDGKYTSDGPFVHQAQSSSKIEFCTRLTQEQLKENGPILRAIFDSCTAKCWVKFSVQRVGLFRQQFVRTKKIDFREW